jgi:hypothetical protein
MDSYLLLKCEGQEETYAQNVYPQVVFEVWKVKQDVISVFHYWGIGF